MTFSSAQDITMKNLTIYTRRKATLPKKAVGRFTVEPYLPENLVSLRKLALNLRWAWDNESRDLFRRLDQDLWEISEHNPYRMLGLMDQKHLSDLADDEAFLARLERIHADFRVYLETKNTWYQKTFSTPQKAVCAYFSMEYGLTECMPIYSGGLGVLSGDHMKTASDLGIPMVGMGILYQEGYFRQYLSSDGWQQEVYPENDFFTMPITKELRKDGGTVTVEIELPDRRLFAQVWRVQVGRVPLFLLDTNIDANSKSDQNITDMLYGGGPDMRILQEIVIGIGGVKALKMLGYAPSVYHMNEGHSAFMGLERLRMLMKDNNLSFPEALEIVRGSVAFTTHTPVPAGIDRFSPGLVEKYFSGYWKTFDISREEFFALGRQNPSDENEPFNMAILAFNLSSWVNGVSKLHGVVSRRIWQNLWPGVPEDEVPISSITNGAHSRTWVSSGMAQIFDRYLGPRWYEESPDNATWEKVERIPALELWRTHERRRDRLVAFARTRLRQQLEQHGAPPSEIEEAGEVLDPNALTIGFARRFATYKRGELLFEDADRLEKILNNSDQPVQVIYAGKAHPQDQSGKEIIRNIVHLARQERFRKSIVFIENYDLNVARYMVQGVDIWLNTPRRFQEASGTSGMKVAVNGGLNVSILDGWWDEAYTPEAGWSIGKGEIYDDYGYQNMVESRALYTVLEKGAVPLFYNRGTDKTPRGWIAKMKASMRMLGAAFSSDRMLSEYATLAYCPLSERCHELTRDDCTLAKKLAAWRGMMADNWNAVRIMSVSAGKTEEVKVSQEIEVESSVRLGKLTPEDVMVEVAHGPLSPSGIIEGSFVERMKTQGPEGTGIWRYKCAFKCATSGRYGYTVRVRPFQHVLMRAPEPAPMEWAEEA